MPHVPARPTAVLLALLALVAGAPAALAASPGGGGPDQVVGGDEVPDGTYPFQAALLDQRYGFSDYSRQFCGGTLITSGHVLTAAHCVDDLDAGVRYLRVVVGRTVLSSREGQKVRVSSVTIHPQFDERTWANDVAVLRLSPPVSGIEPIGLVAAGDGSLEVPGTAATVSGWGNIVPQPATGSAEVISPDRMEAATVPVVSDEACAVPYPDLVGEAMVCAGTTGVDTCQGDSGGPLFVRSDAGFTQIGVTSFGTGCGAPGYPGVYAQLSSPGIGAFIRDATGLPAG